MERSVQAKRGGATGAVDVQDLDIQTANGYAAVDNDDAVYDELQGHEQGRTSQGQGLAAQYHTRASQGLDHNQEQTNLVVFLFWWCFIAVLTIVALFWTDLIPTFGTSSDVEDFVKTYVQCPRNRFQLNNIKTIITVY